MPTVQPKLDSEFLTSPVMLSLNRLLTMSSITSEELQIFMKMPWPLFETRIRKQIAIERDLDQFLLDFIHETCSPQVSTAAKNKKSQEVTPTKERPLSLKDKVGLV